MSYYLSKICFPFQSLTSSLVKLKVDASGNIQADEEVINEAIKYCDSMINELAKYLNAVAKLILYCDEAKTIEERSMAYCVETLARMQLTIGTIVSQLRAGEKYEVRFVEDSPHIDEFLFFCALDIEEHPNLHDRLIDIEDNARNDFPTENYAITENWANVVAWLGDKEYVSESRDSIEGVRNLFVNIPYMIAGWVDEVIYHHTIHEYKEKHSKREVLKIT